jgi:hypothetical protein
MVKAAGTLAGNDVDEAFALALDAVNLAGPLQSNRYVRYLTEFHRSLSANNACRSFARSFAHRVTEVYPEVRLTAGP